MHPSLWSFIRYLQNEESLVSMRLVKIKSGNSRDKSMSFSMEHERARTKTNQLHNLTRLYTVGTIDLKQYLNSLSTLTGDFKKKKKEKNSANTTTPSDHLTDNQDL
jgi:hypothetical protein